MSSLNGARVALLDGRRQDEMARLVRRHGGEPYSVPAVRETPRDCGDRVAALLDRLARGACQATIFLTGAGVNALCEEAGKLGRLPELLTALHTVLVICRGPKPAMALKRHGVPAAVTAAEPHTTDDLLAALAGCDLHGREVAVLHYGERNFALTLALHQRGARLTELCLYEWQPPADTAPLRTLVREIIAGEIDAVTFTSQVQARHLFQVAEDVGLADQLVYALNTRTIVASVAPICLAALQRLGVTPHVVPEHSKMGHLVVALTEHLARSGRYVEPAGQRA